MVPAFSVLAERWKSEAELLKRRGASTQAQLLSSVADDLLEFVNRWSLEELTLNQAALETGLSYHTIQKKVAENKQNSPRLPRLPWRLSWRREVTMANKSRGLAAKWLREAERIAGLEAHDDTQWHAYRRMWATARKGFPIQDVAAAGGWKSIDTVQRIYQQPDPHTVLEVVLGGGEVREAR